MIFSSRPVHSPRDEGEPDTMQRGCERRRRTHSEPLAQKITAASLAVLSVVCGGEFLFRRRQARPGEIMGVVSLSLSLLTPSEAAEDETAASEAASK